MPVSSQSVPEKELIDVNPLVLSFVGDGVHTLFLRTALTGKSPYRNDALHALTSEYACAPAQAEAAKLLLPLLDERERYVFNKAKNAKLNTVPKHATHYQYQLATAFEAVTGYLYLAGNNARLDELYDTIYREKLAENGFSDT